MTRAEWLALGAVLVVPAMYAYEKGHLRWIRLLGRLADKVMPASTEDRMFANFTAICHDLAGAVEAGDASALRGLLSAIAAVVVAIGRRCDYAVGHLADAIIDRISELAFGTDSEPGLVELGVQALRMVLLGVVITVPLLAVVGLVWILVGDLASAATIVTITVIIVVGALTAVVFLAATRAWLKSRR